MWPRKPSRRRSAIVRLWGDPETWLLPGLHDKLRKRSARIRRRNIGIADLRRWRHRRGKANVLLREGLDASNGRFQGLLRSPDILGVGVSKLFLQLVASKIVDGLTHIFRAVLNGVDHARDDERKLHLGISGFRSIVVAW